MRVTAGGLSLEGSAFATLADDFPDQRAVDVVLGHKAGAGKTIRRRHYAKRFDAGRVRKLADYIWATLFAGWAEKLER